MSIRCTLSERAEGRFPEGAAAADDRVETKAALLQHVHIELHERAGQGGADPVALLLSILTGLFAAVSLQAEVYSRGRFRDDEGQGRSGSWKSANGTALPIPRLRQGAAGRAAQTVRRSLKPRKTPRRRAAAEKLDFAEAGPVVSQVATDRAGMMGIGTCRTSSFGSPRRWHCGAALMATRPLPPPARPFSSASTQLLPGAIF